MKKFVEIAWGRDTDDKHSGYWYVQGVCPHSDNEDCYCEELNFYYEELFENADRLAEQKAIEISEQIGVEHKRW